MQTKEKEKGRQETHPGQAHRTGSPAVKHHASLRRDIFVAAKMGGSPAGTPLLPDHQLELQTADYTACLPVGYGQCVNKHPDTHVWSWELGTMTTFGFGQAKRAIPVPMPRKEIFFSRPTYPLVSTCPTVWDPSPRYLQFHLLQDA